MKIGRFDRIMLFNESVVLNCLRVIVLIIACNFSVIAYAQTEGDRWGRTGGHERCHGYVRFRGAANYSLLLLRMCKGDN